MVGYMMVNDSFREAIFAFAEKYMHISLRPHQLAWLEKIHFGGKRILVLAPRGHGKSTIMRIYIMFRICHDPEIKILMASHVESIARKGARAIQVYLERPDIQEDFGFAKGRPWAISMFYLGGKIEPVMTTVAARGGMVGNRYDIIIFDDLLSLENQINESSRDKILNWVKAEVIPAIDPGDREKMIVIGTRKHSKDWYGQLLENEMYTKVTDVAFSVVDGKKEFLWPERFDDEVLKMRLKELGPRLFAQEFLNEVTPHEGLLLRREWIQFYDELPPRHCYKIAMGVDPSVGKTGDNVSSLAIAVIAYDTRPEFHHIYVLELFKQKMTLKEQEQAIIKMFNKYHPVSTNIESVLVNTTFSDRMIAMIPNANPVDYIHQRLRGTSEVSKINRIMTLIGYYFEDGMVSLRNPDTDESTKVFIESEYIEFPDGEKDLLDALNLAVDLVEFERVFDGPLIWTPH
jgi:hypothetical protein